MVKSQVNYEVQVMQGARWTIHARYPVNAGEKAIEDAKQIAVSKIGAVRVLRDIYNSDTNTSNEFIVYMHTPDSGRPVDRGKGHGPGNRDGNQDDVNWDKWEKENKDNLFSTDDADGADKQRAKKRQQKEGKRGQRTPMTLTALIVQLLLILLMSIGVAAACVALAATFLDGVNLFGIHMYGAAKENALIILFLGVFTVMALVLSSVLLRDDSSESRKIARRQRQRSPLRRPPRKVASDASDNNFMPQFGEDYASDGQDNDDTSDNKESASEPERTTESNKPEESADRDHMLSPREEKQKAYMIAFIESALKGTGQDQKSMSTFDKFGASLFIAGACETMANENGMDEDAKDRIMTDSMRTMGFKRDHAQSFAKKYEEYLSQDAGYLQMFQAGRNSMNTYFTDKTRIAKNMAVAMAEWKKPKSKGDQAGTITILFTDIAGSTAMTQELGDAGAQHVVRAHNRIVREALTMWNGKEVKHTGDGIMASFTKASDSVDAAMQMQQEAANYTKQNADKPLYLKIGINSGEPVAEDDDLFGSTVQMAARIVDKAEKEQIFVSEIVRGICAGKKNYQFENRGAFAMKGFDTDPVLYEVMWR